MNNYFYLAMIFTFIIVLIILSSVLCLYVVMIWVTFFKEKWKRIFPEIKKKRLGIDGILLKLRQVSHVLISIV